MTKKKKQKFITILMGSTFILLGLLSFLATPYVFNGFLMSSFFDVVRLVVQIILVVEVLFINILSFSVKERILIWALIVIFGLNVLFLSERMTMNLLIIYASVSGHHLIKKYENETFPFNRLSMMFVVSLLMCFSAVIKIATLNKNAFLLIGLLLGFIVAIILLIFSSIIRKKTKAKPLKLETLLVLLFISPLIGYIFLFTINYSFDISEPVVAQYEITDLDVQTGYRSPTRYKVFFEIDGKTYHVGVSQSDYYGYEIGDIIEIKTYQGFLREAYMINE